jgi:SAM-dependent methyltransferase
MKRSKLGTWLKQAVASVGSPLIRKYSVTKSCRRFTDHQAALALLAPLMETDDEAADYHRWHLNRYLHTLEYLADLPRNTRVLEVAAPPYGMTILMRQWLFDDVSVTGYDEKSKDQLNSTSQRKVTIQSSNGKTLFEGVEHRFNLELHPWPYREEEFDLVIACETFEHLGLDPMHAYFEANRVLKPGGRLFLTVPNGLALSNAQRFLQGAQPNSFPFYRPEGFSLRHLREPTPREVRLLMQAAGFEPEFIETVNFSPPPQPSIRLIALGLILGQLDQRRELLVARGIKRSPPRDRYPTEENLYYHWDVQRLRGAPSAASPPQGSVS